MEARGHESLYAPGSHARLVTNPSPGAPYIGEPQGRLPTPRGDGQILNLDNPCLEIFSLKRILSNDE